MPETQSENSPIIEAQEPPIPSSIRFISDFGVLEKELSSFLELPPDMAIRATLENRDRLEETRHALSDLRNEIRGLLDLLRPYNLSSKKPKALKPDQTLDPIAAKILDKIDHTLSACRDSFRQMIAQGNPAGSTYKACKPPTLAHRLEQAGLMINDLIYFFERIGHLEPLMDPPFKIQLVQQPEASLEAEQDEQEITDEELDREPIKLTEETKALAEELADHFMLIVRRFGLPKPLKIAKGHGQFYPGLIGENLHLLDKRYLDEEMIKGCERLFGSTPDDELVMLRRGNRFCPSIVKKEALIDPTLIPKKPQRIPWK